MLITHSIGAYRLRGLVSFEMMKTYKINESLSLNLVLGNASSEVVTVTMATGQFHKKDL